MDCFKVLLFVLHTLLSRTEPRVITASKSILANLASNCTHLENCFHKRQLIGNTRSMFNIGSKVFIRYESSKRDYQYFIYDTESKVVEEKSSHKTLFPEASANVVFAASITGIEEFGRHNNFLITIEMTGLDLVVQSYFTYLSDDGKQWKKIINSSDLPNFDLKTHGELSQHSENGFWPKDVYYQKIKGFGFNTRERIYVLSYDSYVKSLEEIVYKKVLKDINGSKSGKNWIILEKSGYSPFANNYNSFFEISSIFYVNYITELNGIKSSRMEQFDVSKNGNVLSYSTKNEVMVIQVIFQCKIPYDQHFHSIGMVNSECTSDADNKDANVLLVMLIISFILTGVMFEFIEI